MQTSYTDTKIHWLKHSVTTAHLGSGIDAYLKGYYGAGHHNSEDIPDHGASFIASVASTTCLSFKLSVL
jgi:hypothetical protein